MGEKSLTTEGTMRKQDDGYRPNVRLARQTWGKLSRKAIDALKALTAEHHLSVSGGDLQLLDDRWYV